ncbi:MAG: ATP-binding protein [bacterium]|nr:ATP-binding protein [bacterium]
MSLMQLAGEWERIETLAGLAMDARRGEKASGEKIDQLGALQTDVLKLRENGAWSTVFPTPLERLEYDVLACAIAPELSPRVSWVFQSLNGGNANPYPTVMFLQELLSLEPADAPALYDVIGEDSALRRHRLIRTEGQGPFAFVQPAPGVTNRLIDKRYEPAPPPGTTRVQVAATWDDLVLPPTQMTMLHEFLAYLTCRETVVNQWGARPYSGPIALFSGASGTGKTFAASVLANALGWPLFRVDLGRLVSKYIGETEKNLNALFDHAHDVPMILQFDEADSLFSKRGEVKEARDRYANLEVSHLLARVETHSGPCILTTNLRDQMDAAFARRFQVVIDFPRPGHAARKRLWQRSLPPDAPLHSDVDLDLVADAADLSGGAIRNAAIHAAVLAAHANRPITLAGIARSVWRELGKEGRPVSPSEIGPLARFLDERVQ